VIDHGWPKVDAMHDTLSQYFVLLPNPMYGTWRDAISGKGTDQQKYDAVMQYFKKEP
jgi:predicted secreted acid phosphatase